MKRATVAILLLLAPMVWAQTDTLWTVPPIGFWLNGEFHEIPLEVRAETYPDIVLASPCLTLSDLEGYLEECWNDSTGHDRCNDVLWWNRGQDCTDSSVAVHDYGPPRLTADFIDRVTWEPRYYWTHRTPTLTGFAEYLRRKK